MHVMDALVDRAAYLVATLAKSSQYLLRLMRNVDCHKKVNAHSDAAICFIQCCLSSVVGKDQQKFEEVSSDP